MPICASCGVDVKVGCSHLPLQKSQQNVIDESEEVTEKREKKVAPRSEASKDYIPGQRDYSGATSTKVALRSTPSDEYVPAVRDYSTARESRPSVIIGAKGDRGEPGKDSTVPGPAGRDGKDADPVAYIAAARSAMREELADAKEELRKSIVVELKAAGAVDQFGRAILLPGPAGAPGQSIVGPAGKDGQSIVGPAGKNGVDGQSVVGPAGRDGSIAEAAKAAKEYVQHEIADLALGIKEMILQILVERNVLDADGKAVPGPEGKPGTPGPRGGAGDISAALANTEKLLDKRLAEFRVELRLKGENL